MKPKKYSDTPLIQLELPKDINIRLKEYMAQNRLNDKRIAIIQILKEKFRPDIKAGFKNLMR